MTLDRNGKILSSMNSSTGFEKEMDHGGNRKGGKKGKKNQPEHMKDEIYMIGYNDALKDFWMNQDAKERGTDEVTISA
jgi:hypothetical protein